jgi:hypothetical protein
MKASPAAKTLRMEKARATVQGENEEEPSLHQNLKLLEDFAMLSDFDVLSELPQAGKKADDYLLELPPEEQDRALANDQQFQSLRPGRQERIRENLRRWNALSPDQKDLIRQRQELFASLSPAQRGQARAVYPEWRRLEPTRQVAVLVAFHQLRSLPPGERENYLSGPEVQQQFSPQERRVLEGLGQLLPGSPLESQPQPEQPQE